MGSCTEMANCAVLPATGRGGWPWDVPAVHVPERMADGKPWPRWSVVLPSFNQGQYIEEALRSVLLQGYPDLELIVIDGGSTDGTTGILRKYDQFISYWESVPDRGQTHAINKGFERATGEVLSWVNTDDYLMPGAAAAAIELLCSDPAASIVYGHTQYFNSEGPASVARMQPFTRDNLLVHRGPAVFHVPFLRADAFRKLGLLREELHFAMDYEYCCRMMSAGMTAAIVDTVVSAFRVHDASKTCSPVTFRQYYREESAICCEYGGAWLNSARRTYWRICARDTVAASPARFLLDGYRALKRRVMR